MHAQVHPGLEIESQSPQCIKLDHVSCVLYYMATRTAIVFFLFLIFFSYVHANVCVCVIVCLCVYMCAYAEYTRVGVKDNVESLPLFLPTILTETMSLTSTEAHKFG